MLFASPPRPANGMTDPVLTKAILVEDSDGSASRSSSISSDTLSRQLTERNSSEVSSTETYTYSQLRDKLSAAQHRLVSLEAFYSQCASQPGGLLDRHMLVSGSHEAMARVSATSVLWTSTPFAAGLTKFWAQAVLFSLGMVFAWIGFQAWSVYSWGGASEHRFYKYTSIELRSGDAASSPNIANFGLLRRGCPIDLNKADAHVYTNGSSIIVRFPEDATATCSLHGGIVEETTPMKMDGWFMETWEGSTEEDPVKFTLHASDDGQSWHMIGSSYWVFDYEAAKHPMLRNTYPTPQARRKVVVFDLKPHWAWIVVKFVLPWSDACLLILASFIGALGRAQIARVLLIAGQGCFCFLHFAACTGSSMQYASPLVESHWLIGLARLAIASSVVFERVFCALLGDVLIIIHIVYERNFACNLSSCIYILLGLIWAVAVVAIVLNHKATLREARRLVEPDREKYDAAWDALLQDEDAKASLHELRSLVLRIDTSLGTPRQYNRRKKVIKKRCSIKSFVCTSSGPFASSFMCKSFADDENAEDDSLGESFRQSSSNTFSGSNSSNSPNFVSFSNSFKMSSSSSSSFSSRDWRSASENALVTSYVVPSLIPGTNAGVPGSVDKKNPVWSLDQLYTQAVGTDGELRVKVQQFAFESEGRLPVMLQDGRTMLMTWEDISKDEYFIANVKWAKVKSAKRAIEKLLRSYRGDVSRLVDVCRQSIVFDTVANLVTCLRCMGSDREIVIERIKNRLHPEYDSKISAGYRDVAVNLRIVNETTQRLGIDAHVCELQLILRPYYELKDDEGHARYVHFRNCRGE